MKKNETFIGIILSLIAALGLVNEYIKSEIESVYEAKIEDEIMLSNLYNETNALQLEYINLLIRNQIIAFSNLWNTKLKDSDMFDSNTFVDSKEWDHWKEKSIGEYWEYSNENHYKILYESYDNLNFKRKNRLIVSSSDRTLSIINSIVWITQLILTLLTIFLFYRMIRRKATIPNK